MPENLTVGDFPLNGKIAVVTGAGSGINLSFAKSAVKQGARVIVADLKLTEDGKKFINKAGAKSAMFTNCDVSKRADLENLITVSEKEFGDVPDVYVAGAGVFEPPWSNFWDDTEEDGYSTVDINLIHPLKLSRIAIRSLLKKNKKGVILITASISGYLGNLSAALYCSTKHGIVGFVRSVADLDRLEGIKIVLVAPGLVRTPLWTDSPEKMKRFGYSDQNSITPEDVAKSMIDLVTDGKYGGGTCLETSAGGERILGTWSIEPPPGISTERSPEAMEKLHASTLEKLKTERSA